MTIISIFEPCSINDPVLIIQFSPISVAELTIALCITIVPSRIFECFEITANGDMILGNT